MTGHHYCRRYGPCMADRSNLSDDVSLETGAATRFTKLHRRVHHGVLQIPFAPDSVSVAAIPIHLRDPDVAIEPRVRCIEVIERGVSGNGSGDSRFAETRP